MKQIEQTISSLEVAEMVSKPHNDLLKDIRRYCEQFSLGNISQSDFFTESTYKTERGKEYPCYNVTKKGCEFIAHKLTGVKGTEFTAKYINRFHQMEEIISQHVPQGKELLALAVLEAQKTIEEQNQEIERMKPKEIFADSVTASKDSILVRELAKIIKQNGVEIGEKRLYEWFRANGYICKGTTEPTQKAMNLGLFERIVRTINRGGDVPPIAKVTTKVTGKGQQYFINKFIA